MNVSRNCARSRTRFRIGSCFRLGAIGLPLLLSTAALADSVEPAVPSISRLLLGLMAVLALLALCAWVIRRGGLTGHSGAIKIVSQCAVGTRERVVLVQVGEQQLLIGVTPQQISLLHALAQPVELPVASAPSKFAEQLAQLMKGQRPS